MVSKLESQKDTLQVLTESAASHVGNIAMIITGAVRDVAGEVGDWASDAFEMRDGPEGTRAGRGRDQRFSDGVRPGGRGHRGPRNK
jgi:hypothetical protein